MSTNSTLIVLIYVFNFTRTIQLALFLKTEQEAILLLAGAKYVLITINHSKEDSAVTKIFKYT